MDFTLKTYNQLLNSLLRQGFSFQRFDQFIEKPLPKTVVLRHDVDLLPFNSLKSAKLENELGIYGTYFFRAIPASWNERIMKEIASLGHEIGYHYESLATCRGDYEKAIHDFGSNLNRMRELFPVITICMHGSPLSKYDSRLLWHKYNYREFSIIGEPYFDVDFSQVLYLTDTGRRWDGEKVSVRDKVRVGDKEKGGIEEKERSTYVLHTSAAGEGEGKWGIFRSTFDIINAAEQGLLPDKIMITVHPQRWTDKPVPWIKELVFQNVKNAVKRYFYVK